MIDNSKLDLERINRLLESIVPTKQTKEELDNLRVEYEEFILNKIMECINNINFIINSKIDNEMENKVFESAIRMNIMRIDEEFSRLKDENTFEILKNFDSEDLESINKARNFIEYNYDDIEDELIEKIVKDILPKIKNVIENINLSN
ncbi:HepT-like ribonuclease domain-containing protein [Aliarcobacter butzleri]|uniref:HepT-like ribonuclease domain-containing protein n=1 Tax=Aliarcobacter butzleri TaxID=28197 RepID=UPI003AF5955D